MILQNRERLNLIATDFISSMAEAESADELAEHIDNVGHIFNGIDWLDICLCSDWQVDMNNLDNFRQYGYSDDMYILLSKRFGENEKAGYSFPTAGILPALNRPHEPHIIIMTSLHCSGQIFGYAAAAYTDSRKISADEYYMSWCDSVSNGIKALQKRLYAQHFSRQLEKLSETDPISGMLNRRGFMLHAPEVLNKYSSEGRKSYLLTITYYPDKIGAVSSESVISGIIMNICAHRLCGKLSENIYAIAVPTVDEEGIINTSENVVAAIESGLNEKFGDVKPPGFVTEIALFTSCDISHIEKIIHESIQSVTDKINAAKSNYTDYKEQIYHLRRNIISSPQKEWDVEEMAREIGISRSHLQRLYKQLFSVSVKDDVISARIKKAIQLLTHTEMRVQEVAEQCGYNNENHFMRQFKEKTGRTAAQYRKENRTQIIGAA